MRERKHRAWHTRHKEMLYGTSAEIFTWQAQGQPLIIMDWTGLKYSENKLDSTGYKYDENFLPWEGDILFDNHSETVGVIEFIDGGFFINFQGWVVSIDDVFRDHDTNHIGNIHENPELLEK